MKGMAALEQHQQQVGRGYHHHKDRQALVCSLCKRRPPRPTLRPNTSFVPNVRDALAAGFGRSFRAVGGYECPTDRPPE
ncbi:hypothetical protein RB195_013272 [Necator americanus]|uniref:Uncharacterized protein n=1 Tax=Necator americanus TaxID=51031 RepID=A0ABR1DXF6_NECAM